MKNSTKVEQLPLAEGVRVVASNEDGLVALDKPVLVRSHPNTDDQSKPSILNAAYDHKDEVFIWQDAAGMECRAWLINRLDSPTSGILLLGLNPEVTTVIKQQFAAHKVEKVYYAIVRHRLKSMTGTWRDRLTKASKKPGRTKSAVEAVSAIARFKWLKSPKTGFAVSLIQLMPTTGRTHQLRIQCQKHGHAIVGDQTYGDFSFNREVHKETRIKRMFLHSGRTRVNYSLAGKARSFEAKSPLPEAYTTVMEYKPGLSRGVNVKREEFKSKTRLDQRRFRR